MPNFPAVDATGAFINPDVLTRLDERISTATASGSGPVAVSAFGASEMLGASPYSASASAYAFKGETFTANVTGTVTAVTALMNTTTTGTYRAMVVRIANGAIAQVVATSPTQTPAVTVTGARLRFPVNVPVTPGVQYSYLVGVTNAGDTHGTPVGASSVVPRMMSHPSFTYTGTASPRIASVAPTVGTAVDLSSPNTVAGFLVGVELTATTQITTGINSLADVDTATTPPTDGQALVFTGGAWKPGAGSGGGTVSPGTLVWRGEWAAGSYPVGAVVRHDRQLWTARTATSLTPSHPVGASAGLAEAFTSGKPTGAAWSYAESGGGVSVTTDLTTGSLGSPPPGATHALELRAGQSGATTATLTVTAPASGTVTFWEAISAEGTTYDYGSFLIDGVLQGSTVAPDASRVIAWRQRTVALTAGTRTLTWKYQKDSSQDHGRDAYLVTGIVVSYPQDWEPFTPAHLAGSGGGGGAVQPGTMVWKGAWAPSVGYVYGDVVTHDKMLWVAKEATLNGTPGLPGIAFGDDFNRPDGTVGQFWDVTAPDWLISAGKATVTRAGDAFLIRTGLNTDGTGYWLGTTTGHPWQQSGPVFAYTDALNHYRLNTYTGHLERVQAGTVTQLGRPTTTGGATYSGEITTCTIRKTGGSIQITVVKGPTTFQGAFTDPSPLNGTGWGYRGHGTQGYNTSTLDAFEYTPPTTNPWNVLERRWSTTSLDDVFAPTVLDGQQLVYNGPAARWEPRTISTNSVAAVVHGADATVGRPTAVSVHWYGSVAPLNAQPRDEWIEEQA